jgi:hypothetical protein
VCTEPSITASAVRSSWDTAATKSLFCSKRARDEASARERTRPTPLTQDATAFAFGCAAPHALIDAIQQRVLEALALHGTASTDALRGFDAEAVGWEEGSRVRAATLALQHPRVFVGNLMHALHPVDDQWGPP